MLVRECRRRRHHDDVHAEIQNVSLRGDDRAHAVLVLRGHHPVEQRGHEHAFAQGMQPERDCGTRPARLAGMYDGERRAARSVDNQRVEAHDRSIFCLLPKY